MFLKLRKRIKSKSGETLIETLFALLIGVLALIMLPGAIVAATRANKESAENSVYTEGNSNNVVTVTGFSID
ncbi:MULTISPECIES: type II secretion system protein [unclassified Butyrivibrio]|uniref:type II secretion system protein n=1 Tax=unclassified Butyrivibrio TaxID=2639466 RepID=UPI0003B43692|nr:MULTISPECIES: type II secretion system protein [unclassified Butyrivibrio]SEK92802.1 hypothetical protein SAMN04487770_10487 [Butyrivibrio sp. ob235]